MGTKTKQGRMLERLEIHARDVIRTLLEVIYGMTLYDWVRDLDKSRAEKNRLFTLMVFGDLLGIPLLPPYYTLRLLPYMVPIFHSWKRSMLRERDMIDLIG